MFQSIAVPVIFILGIFNVVIGLLILLSCRCIPGLKLTDGLMRYPAYKCFYKYHCYLWWVFWPSVLVHAIFAIAFFGIPL
jgi:hypothetical protein